MSELDDIQLSSIRNKGPLQGVIIFVSQQLGTNRVALHEQCIALGGKFVWIFDVPFTHYICQGKISKRGKEYKKVEEYRAKCVHPAWLKACEKFGERVAEKLYATTYNPNRSLTFISATDDEDEENHISSLRTKKPILSLKHIQTPRSLSILNKKQQSHIITPESIPSSKLVAPILSPKNQSSQNCNEAETMLNDLESSLAQFLHNNSNVNSISFSRTDEQNRKSLPMIRSMGNMNNENLNIDIESSMRVEWLDDAMRAERKKIIDEDEYNVNNQQQSRCNQLNIGQKRPLVDSNIDQNLNTKKCRI